MNALDFLAPLGAIDGCDPELRALVALHTADAMTCLAAGVEAREGAALAAFYRGAAAQGSCSMLDLAAGAAAVIRFTEWDAIHVPSCATPGAVAVPAALAFAGDIESYVSAVVAGHAVGVALAEAIGGVDALPETWPGLFAAPAVAAVSASIALRLTPEETAQAVVMSLGGSSGRNGRPSGSPSARWLAIGEATLKGMRAALAAQAGLRGDLALLLPAWLQAQARNPIATGAIDLQLDAIGNVGPKPFVAARQGMNAIEAFLPILAGGVDAGTIEEVRVFLPSVAVPVVSRPLDTTDRLSTIAHLGLQLGIAACEAERLTDVGRETPFAPESLALAGRVRIIADDSVDEELQGKWPAKVAVRVGNEWIERTWPQGPTRARAAAVELVEAKIAGVFDTAAAPVLRRIQQGLPCCGSQMHEEAAGLLRKLMAAEPASMKAGGTARRC